MTDSATSADTLYARAVEAAHRGDFGRAEALMQDALASAPGRADIRRDLARVLCALGRHAEAIAHFDDALSGEPPAQARDLCHLGDLLLAAERPSEAEAAYTQALALAPDDPEALRGLGASAHVQKRFDEALLAFSAALGRDPDNPRYHFHLGVLFDHMGHSDDAVNEYRATLALAPDDLQAQMNLAGLLYRMRDWDGARAAYQRALELAPDDTVARYLCAVLGREALAGAPAGYVSQVFDGYADGYEEHMVEVLGYQVPGVMRRVLEAEFGPSTDQRLSLLDLGCGTGLVAEALADLVAIADGVDLSAQMLERARARGRYRELFHDDIVAVLARRDLGLARYDIIAAADVLIYIGDLQPVFAAARERLSATGVLVFSVEDSAVEPYQVRRTGRFAHSSAYIERLAAEHGLTLRCRRPTVLRTESQAPVHGTVFALGRQTA